MRDRCYDILVVEDDEDDQMFMNEAFTELHCQDRVTMYGSSFSFLQDIHALKSLSPLPLLIVLDYNLPGADGMVLLHVIKDDEVLCKVPVVVYSTCMKPHQRQECLQAGADAYFEKKQTYQEVVDFAKQLCEYAFGKASAA